MCPSHGIRIVVMNAHNSVASNLLTYSIYLDKIFAFICVFDRDILKLDTQLPDIVLILQIHYPLIFMFACTNYKSILSSGFLFTKPFLMEYLWWQYSTTANRYAINWAFIGLFSAVFHLFKKESEITVSCINLQTTKQILIIILLLI